MIKNPNFHPPQDQLEILQAGKKGLIGAGMVKGITERIAEQACEALLNQLPAAHRWVNANVSRRNQPGYDYLVNDRVRIQVKGSDSVEQVGRAHKPNPDHPSLDFDALVFVHVGACLATDFGRFAQHRWPKQDCVDYYVIPNAVVRDWVSVPRYLNKGRVELYWNRRDYAPSTKQHLGQTREILTYKDRFDLITNLL